MQVRRSIAAAVATAQTLPQVHHHERFAELLGKAGRKQQPPMLALKLTRFRGHPTFWVEGVHDVEAKSTLPT
jgi:hypothetical protein